jgi:hypothetical protein
MKKMGAKTLADLLRMAGHLGNLLLSGRRSDKSAPLQIERSTVGGKDIELPAERNLRRLGV